MVEYQVDIYCYIHKYIVISGIARGGHGIRVQ